MNIILRVLINSIAVFLVAQYVPGITLTSFNVAVIVAIVLGLINIFVRPILALITLPLNLITFGIFGIILNALMLMLVDSLIQNFSIEGFVPALVASVIISAIAWVGESVFGID